MEAKKPTFIVALTLNDNVKPLPSNVSRRKPRSERIFQPLQYPKFETEFFDVIKDCAVYIDKLPDSNLRLRYTKRMNRVFVERDRSLAMRLFRELVNEFLNRP